MAVKKGWDSHGVEITDRAVLKSRQKSRGSKVFHGTPKKANYEDNFFDVITLWDVLVEVNNPFNEIKECYCVSGAKGKIGIRVRNLFFQKIAYALYLFLIKIKLESKN